MWPVKHPDFSVGDSVDACAEGTRDVDLRRRLRRARGELVANGKFYQQAVSDSMLHSVSESDFPASDIAAEEFLWLYKNQLSKPGRPAREIYDALVEAAPFGLCCYCQYGQAKTLDHFVPKTEISSLAIDPWNLVPACAQCNHKLLAGWSDSAEEQLLHPYSMPDLGRWLRASVADSRPLVLRFFVIPREDIDALLRIRMENEFEVLGLADMYSVVSAGDVEIVSRTLMRELPEAGAEDIQSYLLEVAGDAFSVDLNSRRGVVLEALSEDRAFCEGGYWLD